MSARAQDFSEIREANQRSLEEPQRRLEILAISDNDTCSELSRKEHPRWMRFFDFGNKSEEQMLLGAPTFAPRSSTALDHIHPYKIQSFLPPDHQ
jgi:hypothetical protein